MRRCRNQKISPKGWFAHLRQGGAESYFFDSLFDLRKLFDSLILSVLLYGCETWTLTRRTEDLINSFATPCYRIILNIRRIGRVTNQAVLQQMNRSSLIQTVRTRQLRTLGHWIRATQLPISRYALYKPERGRNRRGRPCLNFCRYIAAITGMPIGDLLEIAVEREDWRRRVVDAHDPHAIDWSK